MLPYCVASTGVFTKGEEEQKIATILSIYHQIPAASSKFIQPLCARILPTEQAMLIEASSPFREVLMKFLLRYPGETMEIFLDSNYIKVSWFILFWYINTFLNLLKQNIVIFHAAK